MRTSCPLALALVACSAADASDEGTDTTSGGTSSSSSTTVAMSTSTSAAETSSSGADESTATSSSSASASSESTTGSIAPDVGVAADCEAGAKPGAGGSTDNWANDSGVLVNLRMPADYDPTIAVPLVVVYAPAGADAGLTEGFTGLTDPTLAEGWAIAYVDHISPVSVQAVTDASVIPGLIAEEWCIDPARIYLTGHSDGGTISEVSVNVTVDPPLPRAAAPSAAGVTGATLGQIGCPAQAVSMMIMHSTGDQLFPIADGFGHDAALFWVGCNGCTGDPVDDGTCETWSTCNDGTTVAYCEGAGVHGQWPGLDAQIIAFFAANG
jgi:polyhydroxybutyrate depolymerase